MNYTDKSKTLQYYKKRYIKGVKVSHESKVYRSLRHLIYKLDRQLKKEEDRVLDKLGRFTTPGGNYTGSLN